MCSSDAIFSGIVPRKTFYARFWVKITGRTRRDRFLSDGRGFKVSLFHAATILMLVVLGPGYFVTSNHIPL